MKLADAPSPGWYPDPDGGARLRWWEGADWTDHRRSALSASALADAAAAAEQAETDKSRRTRDGLDLVGTDPDEIVSQVRDATRREVDRAAKEILQGVQGSIARVRPAIVGYISQILRWVRIGIVTAALLVVAWFVLQFIAQATFLTWLGDRIDNIVD